MEGVVEESKWFGGIEGSSALSRPKTLFSGRFACHLWFEDDVLTLIADVVSVNGEFSLVATHSKKSLRVEGVFSPEGLLSATFEFGRGMQGQVTATWHVGCLIGRFNYLNEANALVESRLRLVPIVEED